MLNGLREPARERGSIGPVKRVSLLPLVILLVIALAVGLIVPAVQPMRHPRRDQCRTNLRLISLASILYADECEDEFPDKLERLYPHYIDNARVFSCPRAPSSWHDFEKGTASPCSSSYTLVPGLRRSMPGDTILAYDRSPKSHGGIHRTIAQVDGLVCRLPEADFQKRMAAQRKSLSAWGKAGAHYADMGKVLRSGANAGTGPEGREDQ